MTKKQEWTVRVVNWEDHNNTANSAMNNQLPRIWVEQLRYMGMARELASYDESNRHRVLLSESEKSRLASLGESERS